MLIFQITLWGTLENTAAIAFTDASSISPRIEPKDTSITPLSPAPFTNSSRSSGSGLAGLAKSGPTDFTSEKKKKANLSTLLMYKVKQYNTKELNRIDHLLFIVNRLQEARSRNLTTIDLEGSCGVLTINHCVVFFISKSPADVFEGLTFVFYSSIVTSDSHVLPFSEELIDNQIAL